jgi:hypothetical protein
MAKKTIKISENAERDVIANVLTEAFYPEREKVLSIKDYLDKNFTRYENIDVDEDGYPKLYNAVQLIMNGQPVKPMTMEELLRHLDDKFINMIRDKSDRRKFLIQVIKDWYNNKIDRNGLLSVNLV